MVSSASRITLSLFAACVLVIPTTAASDTEEAIKALDTDHSGKVDKAEVETFARAQGLSDADVRAEFKDIDLNGDGELSADEISQTLKTPPATSDKAAVPPLAVTQSSVAQSTLQNENLPPLVPPKAQQFLGPKVQPVSAQSVTQPASQLALNPKPESMPSPTLASMVSASSSDSHLDSIEQHAKHDAGKALAEVFARSAAKTLENRSADMEQAGRLEQYARSLRGRAVQLRQTAEAETEKAAAAASAKILQSSAQQVQEMEHQALNMEMQAAAQREEANTAMKKALAAQASMAASVREMSGQRQAL